MHNLFLSVSFIVSGKVGIFSLNMRDIVVYVARWREKYLSKCSPLKHTCSWRDKLIIFFSFPISHFHCAKCRKNPSSRSRVMRMCTFWAQNSLWALFLLFMPIRYQKSKSDINLLVKYLWLKNIEISLAESHFCL